MVSPRRTQRLNYSGKTSVGICCRAFTRVDIIISDTDDFSCVVACAIYPDIPVSKQGKISYTFEIPPAAKGVHIIKVTDDSNWSNITASSDFTVVPSIVMEPPWGKPMNSITIIGNGFAPNETGIKTYFEGKILSKTPIAADKTGSWHSMFQVPDLPKGEYRLSASGDATLPGEVPELVFTISPFCQAARPHAIPET